MMRSGGVRQPVAACHPYIETRQANTTASAGLLQPFVESWSRRRLRYARSVGLAVAAIAAS